MTKDQEKIGAKQSVIYISRPILRHNSCALKNLFLSGGWLLHT